MHEGKNKGSITLEQMYTDMIKKILMDYTSTILSLLDIKKL